MEYSAAMNSSMMLTCNACRTDLLVGEEYLQCMVEACGKLYHYACNNKTLTADEKATWACPECTCAAKKSGRNCETPVGTPVNIKNVTYRNVSMTAPLTPELRSPKDNMPKLASIEIQLLREQMTMLSEQLADAVAIVGQYYSALTVCTGKVDAIGEKLEMLEKSIESRCLSCAGAPPPAACTDVVETGNFPELPAPRCNRTDSSKPLARPSEEYPLTVPESKDNDTTPVEHIVRNEDSPGADCNSNASGKFETARTKRQSLLSSIRCTGGPNVTALKAVEHMKYIHLWNMVSNADDVQKYLSSLCQNRTCTVEELKSKGKYKSYKLGVPASVFNICLSPDVWPENARIKMWFFRRPGTYNHQASAKKENS